MLPAHLRAKRDFLGKPAPPGYVAGIGRGATGFTTRSDIGPAREAAAAVAAAALSGDDGPARKLARRTQGSSQPVEEEDEEKYLHENNYDEFAGYGGSLVSKDPYEEDDQEADRIYDAIDRHLDERGKALREAKTRQQLELYRQERPKIQQQFSDLKSGLCQLSESDWMSIPEVGDARNRKQRVARQDKFTPVPDSLLAHQARLATGGEQLVYLDPTTHNPADDDDNDQDDEEDEERRKALMLEEVNESRGNFMKIKLDAGLSNATGAPGTSLEGQAVAQAQASRDYLTNLQSMVPTQITDATTLKEYRRQFASLRASNPTFVNGWIASVRLEEAAGKLKTARSLVLAACEKCPKSADLWFEAVRLHPPEMAKALLVKALKENPRSVKLWIKAAEVETDDESRRRVYAKARELLPKSVLIWKKSVELEKPDGARCILREAVECCPEAVELWLALARLLPYTEAQRVLIRASNHNPSDRGIWITAAKLEEAASNRSLVGSIVEKAIEQLTKGGQTLDRAEWLAEAVQAEKANSPLTCREIVKRVIKRAVPQDKLQQTLLDEAHRFVATNSIECARATFETLVSDEHLCKSESNWLSFVEFERKHGTPETLDKLLKRSVEKSNCPKSEELWLMRAHEKRHQLDEARQLLSDALGARPDSERIILAAVQLECENNNHLESRRILAEACRSAKTPQLVLKWARLEWAQGAREQAIKMLSAATQDYKDTVELHLTLADFWEQMGDRDKCKRQYAEGLKYKPTSVELWLQLAGAEERSGNLAKARSKLEMARLRNPKVAQLWLESARLERRAAGKASSSVAGNLLARGIRECRGQPEVESLLLEQASLSRRKI